MRVRCLLWKDQCNKGSEKVLSCCPVSFLCDRAAPLPVAEHARTDFIDPINQDAGCKVNPESGVCEHGEDIKEMWINKVGRTEPPGAR